MAQTPSLTDVSVIVTPGDGQALHDHSIQVDGDATITLKWQARDATGVRIDALGSFGASGSTTLPAVEASYLICAFGPGGATSAPWPLEVHTHDSGELVSQHINLVSGEHPALENPAPGGIEGCIDSSNCDRLMQRGDILIKFAGENSTLTEKLIMGGEKALQKLAKLFHEGLAKGDPTCFHAALYLGNGKTAEAHGGDISTARVGLRSIDDHAGFLFQVYRPKDRRLADAAAKVGETWGNRRMHYKVPALVLIENASYGPRARDAAMDYATHADTAGGPPDVTKMFCSEFVIACYQAAAGAALIAKKGKVKAKELDMPLGVDLHASHASPLALDARLVEGVQDGGWRHVAEVLVRPQHAGNAAEVSPGADVTKTIADVGIPTAKRWPSGKDIYARNPWSLRAFDGKLFVASGNANNPGPAPNQGPVDLWAFDGKEWKSEYVVQDEQVDVMPVLDGQLYIPGTDSHIGDGKKISAAHKLLTVPEDWAFGNLHHRLSGGRWEQLRCIPNGIHVYDVISFAGQLFAATGTLLGGTVAHSKDGGLSWKEMGTHTVPGQRTRSLFVLGGKLYGSTSGGLLYAWDGAGSMKRVMCDLFPGVADNTTLHCARPVTFKDRAVYLAARKLVDHDWTAEGLFAMSTPDESKLVKLPGGALARDLRVIDGKLYVLATQQPTPDASRTRLFETTDLETFKEVLRFDRKTWARSFDKLGGDWYFGLGSDPEWISPETGRVLRAFGKGD